MNELDEWLSDSPVPCPFFETLFNENSPISWFFCGIENLKINFRLEKQLGKLLCCDTKTNKFLVCPFYQKAIEQYKQNPAEFQVFLTAMNGKLSHMEEGTE